MTSSSRLRSRCPHCQRLVVGGSIHLSKLVICPGCKREFRFAVQVAGAGARAARADDSASSTIATRDIPPELLALVPAAMARAKRIIPFAQQDGLVTIAAPDAMDFDLEQQLEFLIGHPVRLVAASPAELAEALERHYGVEDGAKQVEQAESDLVEQQDEVAEEDSVRATVRGTIQEALETAARVQAAEVVFAHRQHQPLEVYLRLRDGRRLPSTQPPEHLAERIMNFLKSNIGRDGDAILELGGVRRILKADRHHDQQGDQIVLHVQ